MADATRGSQRSPVSAGHRNIDESNTRQFTGASPVIQKLISVFSAELERFNELISGDNSVSASIEQDIVEKADFARAASLLQELSTLVSRNASMSDLREDFRDIERKILARIVNPDDPIAVDLPLKAPVLWKKRDRSLKESQAEFILRVYGQWIRKRADITSYFILERTLTAKTLRRLDPTLYSEFATFRAAGGHIPAELFLYTKQETTDMRLQLSGVADNLPDETTKEVVRLFRTKYTRRHRHRVRSMT